MVELENLCIPLVHFPADSIVMYVSSLGVGSPKRILESHRISSAKLNVQESARCDFNMMRVYGEDIRHFGYRINDLQGIKVKTKNGRKIRINLEQEGDVRCMKMLSSASVDLNLGEESFDRLSLVNYSELHVFISEEVKIPSLPVNKVCKFSIATPEVIREMKLEILEYESDHQRFRWSSAIHDMINSTLDGLRNGRPPVEDEDGSEFYFMPHSSGNKIVSVFKLLDTYDIFVLPGDGANCEVAAYLLDHPRIGHREDYPDDVGHAGVPPTTMVQCWHNAFNNYGNDMQWIVGMLQMYEPDACEDKDVSCFPVEEVHKISVLDIRLANSNRNRGNIVVTQEEGKEIRLTPINHRSCFPKNLDNVQFVWMDWPQAQEPYSPEIVEYVENLNAEKDIQFLESYGWEIGSETARLLKICTMLLKEAVKRNLTAFHIANIMAKRETGDENTLLQKMVLEAEDLQKMVLEAEDTDDEDGYFQKLLDTVMTSHLDGFIGKD